MAKVNHNLLVFLGLVVATRLGERTNRVEPYADAITLVGHGTGQKQIGTGTRKRSHEHVDIADEIDLVHRAVDTRGILAHICDGIGRLNPEHAHRTRVALFVLACLDGIENCIRLRACRETRLLERILGIAEALLDHALFKILNAGVVAKLETTGLINKDVTAGIVNVAGNARKVGDGKSRLRSDLGHVNGKTPLDGGGVRLRIKARSLNKRVLVDPADFGDLLRRILLHALLELFEAIAPFLDELMVIEVFVNDDVHHAKSQRRISTRTQAQPVFGTAANPGELRIDADKLTTTLHSLDNPMPEECIRIAYDRIRAPEDDAPGNLPILILLIAPIAELRHIRNPLVAHNHIAQRRTRQHAAITREEAQGEIRTTEVRVLIMGDNLRNIAPGTNHRDDGLRSALFLELTNVLLDDFVGLVPANALPGILAALIARTLHGILQPILA